MSDFHITGTVGEIQKLTSQKGAAYIKFRVTDSESVFDLSLFGSGMSMASKLVAGVNVEIKGMLTSREYQGKHYPNFQVQWIEGVADKTTATSTTKAAANDMFESIPF